MSARHYAPEFGRFLTPDPSDLEANLYASAGNSPLTKIDPDGHHHSPFHGQGQYGGRLGSGWRSILAPGGGYWRLPNGQGYGIPRWSGGSLGNGGLAFIATLVVWCRSHACDLSFLQSRGRWIPRNDWLPPWAAKEVGHKIKDEMGGNSRQDIWVDGEGNLILQPRGNAKAEGTDTGWDAEDVPGGR